MAAMTTSSVCIAPVARVTSTSSKTVRAVAVRSNFQGKSMAVSFSRKQTASRSVMIVRASEVGKEEITKAIDSAKDTCEDGSAGECAAAWDTVEELSAEAAHKQAKKPPLDPMEEYCKEAPDADECRIYED